MEQQNISSAIQQLVEPSIEDRWFTPEETAAIKANSYKYDIGVFIRLSLDTGLSIAEINGLHWNSLEYDSGDDYEYYELYVSEVRYDTPLPLCNTPDYVRTGCFRKLSLPINTGRELVQWRELHTIRNTSYILVDENGDLMEWYGFSKKYNQMLRAAHVRPLAFDALRNTFVFNALNAGLSVDVIKLILGFQPSYELSEAEAAQIGQKFACGFPASLIDVFPRVDYTPIDPEIKYIREKNKNKIRLIY